MEDSMADDPNIGMPGNLLQMAASDWEQAFFDMAANWETYGSVVRPEEPRPEHDQDHEENKPNLKDEDDEPNLKHEDDEPNLKHEDFEPTLKHEDYEPTLKHDPDHENDESNPEADIDPDEEDYEPNYSAMVAKKWNPIFERLKADEHDVECMFFHTRQGCLAPAGTCPFKHTPLRDHMLSNGGYHRFSAEGGYNEYDFYMNFIGSD
ncbi:hypothetical protein B0H19DRAFT_1192791 [Mycena capillaripes]|nr:hypothetical protein B0H19DRAFT_1192791 [Mycena capillaripes]